MINIKMNSYDMCVSVKLSNEDEDYEVNTSGFLRTLDDFLSKLELYDNVDIEIKRETPSVTEKKEAWPFDSTVTTPSTSTNDTVTVPSVKLYHDL